MEASTFRSTQAPLRDLYSKDAKSAFLTLRARGIAGDSTVTCKVETGRGLATAGIHPKAGGSGRNCRRIRKRHLFDNCRSQRINPGSFGKATSAL